MGTHGICAALSAYNKTNGNEWGLSVFNQSTCTLLHVRMYINVHVCIQALYMYVHVSNMYHSDIIMLYKLQYYC